MITVLSLIETATDLTAAHVASHAEAMQAAVGEEPLGAVFNRVTDQSQKGIDYARGAQNFDAIAQTFFPDISASMSAASNGGFNLAMGLSGPMVAQLHALVCLQNTIIAPPPPEQGLKRMSVLRKRPDVSPEAFQEQWFYLHAELAKRLPGVTGYRQNLVLDGPRDAGGAMMVDGMVELWFPDGETIDSAFATGPGESLMVHAKEFIAEISTFLVAPHHVRGVH